MVDRGGHIFLTLLGLASVDVVGHKTKDEHGDHQEAEEDGVVLHKVQEVGRDSVDPDGQAAAEGHGFQAHTGPMRSVSRGAVTLRSSDPADDPKILFNYMSDINLFFSTWC